MQTAVSQQGSGFILCSAEATDPFGCRNRCFGMLLIVAAVGPAHAVAHFTSTLHPEEKRIAATINAIYCRLHFNNGFISLYALY